MLAHIDVFPLFNPEYFRFETNLVKSLSFVPRRTAGLGSSSDTEFHLIRFIRAIRSFRDFSGCLVSPFPLIPLTWFTCTRLHIRRHGLFVSVWVT